MIGGLFAKRMNGVMATRKQLLDREWRDLCLDRQTVREWWENTMLLTYGTTDADLLRRREADNDYLMNYEKY